MGMLLIGVAVGIVIWICRYIVRSFIKRHEAYGVPEVPDETIDASGRDLNSSSHPSPTNPFAWLNLRLVGMAAVGLALVGSLRFALHSNVLYPHIESAWPASESPSAEFLIGVLYFIIMLAGMAGEYMFGLKDFKKFTFAEFVRPFWVALIVFSVPWSLVDKSALTFGSVLACYQNGFFWKKVLERRRGR
jgi:hypothetical protein